MPEDAGCTEAQGGDDSPGRTPAAPSLGPALRRAWLGYQQRLDDAMAVAGFDGRTFPDGRVLRLCSDPAGTTIAGIGRDLGMTRQGAGKVVGRLRDRGWVSIADSATSRREKSVTLTPLGVSYLDSQRVAAREIERQLGQELGEPQLAGLYRLLDVLGDGRETRMRTYLQRSAAGFADPRPGRDA